MNQPGQELSISTEGLRPRIRALADDGPTGSYPPGTAPQAPSGYVAPATSYANAPAPGSAPVPPVASAPPAGGLASAPPPPFLVAPAAPPPLNAPPQLAAVPRLAEPAAPAIAPTESYPSAAPQFLSAPEPRPFLTAPAAPPLVTMGPLDIAPLGAFVAAPASAPLAAPAPQPIAVQPVAVSAPVAAPAPIQQQVAAPAPVSVPLPAQQATAPVIDRTPVPAPVLPPPAVHQAPASAAQLPTALLPTVQLPAVPVAVHAAPPVAEPVVDAIDIEWNPAPDTDAAPVEEKGFWTDDDSADANPQAPLKTADRDLVAALQEVLLSGASDLHVTVNAPPMIRVDGGLRPIVGSSVWDRTRVSAALRSILNPLQRENFERELELDFAYTISANARFRVNIYQQRGSMGAAFRLIPTEIKALADLGVPDAVSRFATLARGLVLVTGPTGSGKSTTLAALVDLVNRTRADHIVTVEDPIEFLHQNHKSLVNQREVGPDTHSFGAALKHVLRQDPDVILIGELRDLETISVALTAAETGHLVFATLHTQDAAQTIDRVIDVFPPHQQGQVRSQLAAVLQGVVCQTLVKRASGKGRVVATEVLVMTPAVANLIREGKTYQIPSALQAGRELGMYTMDQHLAELVDAGQITHQAAMDKAHDAEGIRRLIHRADPGAGGPGNTMAAASGVDYGDFSSAGQR